MMNYMNPVNDSPTFNSKRRNLTALIAMLDGRADCCYSDKHLISVLHSVTVLHSTLTVSQKG